MSDPHDVSTHFHELKKQLSADGFDSTTPIGEVLLRLHASLLDDGFSLETEAVVEAVEEAVETTATEAQELVVQETVIVTIPEVVVPETVHMLQAFRMFSSLDSEALLQFFTEQNLHAQTLAHSDKFFVIASSAPITKDSVKAALRDYTRTAKR